MSKVSILIPARNERFLSETVDDIFKKASGDIEVIVNLDGYWPEPILSDRKNLILLHPGESRGMRWGINSCASIAKGDFLMKCDAHCSFAEGFDEVLKADCDEHWLVVPRRYSLDAELWLPRMEGLVENPKHHIDYHYLDCPFVNPAGFQFHGVVWMEKTYEREGNPEYDVDDLMSWQGSCWFMTRKHWDWLGRMSEHGYGTFKQEPQEIGNKTWLGHPDGAIKINKKTWYAHLHKGKQYGRGYHLGRDEMNKGHEYSAAYWMNNCWENRVRDIEWLIDKFWPVPTWPDNWRELLTEWRKSDDVAKYLHT